ncbi:MAG: hypothetical protein GY851_33160 [bacterium]|nr:hypothetical protein [bacterium]
MMEDDLRVLYLRRLERWPAAMKRYLYQMQDDKASGCFGPGDHGHWSMQANATAAAAFAVLAVEPQTDAARAGMSRDEMLGWALRMVRFTVTSHHANGGATTDGEPWGHSWISALCLERLAHGIDALGDLLPESDRELLRRVLVSESDWLLDHYKIVAGLVDDNKPESNIWNGCLLHRTTRMVPDAARRDEYLDKGTRFLVNGISAPADAENRNLIAGRTVADWHIGANMFDTMACNHHGYLNVGYMVICLSNIAMMHFACRANGWAPPEGLYHHARELWQLVKTCTFDDGRLWRIGGDTRVRYCYCQDYAIPTWLLARDRFGDDDTEGFERGWLGILESESAASEDNAFLSTRLAALESASPLYYTRLEGDRAVSLSMGAYWHRLLAEPAGRGAEAVSTPVLRDWSDEYHGSVLARGQRRMASWTWRAGEPPQGLCVPPDASSMVEWRGNLGARIRGTGVTNDAQCEWVQCESFPGGFATCGQVRIHTRDGLAEGELPGEAAVIDLACVALPDDRTMVVLQRARVRTRTWLREVKGLFLQIPNDVFNGMQRTYRHAGGRLELDGCPEEAEARSVAGDWLNIDSCLCVVKVYGPDLVVNRPAGRQVGIRSLVHQLHAERGDGNLHVDEICMGCQTGFEAHDAGEELFDLGAVVLCGVTEEETVRLVDGNPPIPFQSDAPDVRGVRVTGADGRTYVVIANFGDDRTVAIGALQGSKTPHVVAGGSVEADAGGSRILVPRMHVAVVGE